MCGIFGIIATTNSEVKLKGLGRGIAEAMLESERRGKDASGVLAITNQQVLVAKSSNRAKCLVKSNEFKRVLNAAEADYKANLTFAFIGHTRMATHGSAESADDNQPIIQDKNIVTAALRPRWQWCAKAHHRAAVAIHGETSRQYPAPDHSVPAIRRKAFHHADFVAAIY